MEGFWTEVGRGLMEVVLQQVPSGRSEIRVERPRYAILECCCSTSLLCIRIFSIVKGTVHYQFTLYQNI